MTPETRALFAHLSRALARYVPEATAEARTNGVAVPAELVTLAVFFRDCATVRQDATSDAPAARSAEGGPMTSALLLTKRESAPVLGLSVRQLERLIAAGEIPAVRVGGAVRLRRSDLEHYVANLSPKHPGFRDSLVTKDPA